MCQTLKLPFPCRCSVCSPPQSRPSASSYLTSPTVADIVEPVTDTGLAQEAHKKSGHLGRPATHGWAQDCGMPTTRDAMKETVLEYPTCWIWQKQEIPQQYSTADTAAKTPCPNLANGFCGAVTLLSRLSVHLWGRGYTLLCCYYAGYLTVGPSAHATQKKTTRGA